MADLIEIVQFRVARGIDEKTFSKASDAGGAILLHPRQRALLAGS